jgi:hypothetical protein
MRCHRPMLSLVASRPAMRLPSSLVDPPSSIRNRHSTLVLSLEGIGNRQCPSSLRPPAPSCPPFWRFGVSTCPFVPSISAFRRFPPSPRAYIAWFIHFGVSACRRFSVFLRPFVPTSLPPVRRVVPFAEPKKMRITRRRKFPTANLRRAMGQPIGLEYRLGWAYA